MQGTAKRELGRKLALALFRRSPRQLIMVGPVASEIHNGFGLARTEELLDSMVEEGLLRPATEEELQARGRQHGYYLTEKGVKELPSEW